MSTLTQEERDWLREHPDLSVAYDPAWPPMEFSDAKGEWTGMSRDYLALLEQRLGVKLIPVKDLSWQEMYSQLRRWEIDLAACVSETPERKKFWVFTEPYLKIPIVISTQLDVTYIADMKELEGKKVALVKDYAIDEWVTRDYPKIQLVRVKNPTEGLDLLQRGEVFAYIDNLLIVGYYQAQMRISAIKIAGQTPYVNAQRIGIRKDWAILAKIFQKGLDSITEAEREEIYRKWLPVRYEYGFDYSLFWKVLAVFGMILIALIAWNRILLLEIKTRVAAQDALAKSEQRFQSIFLNAAIGIFQSSPEGRFISMNFSGARILGYSSPEELLENVSDIARQVFFDASHGAELRKKMESVTGSLVTEEIFRRRNGELITVNLLIRAVRDDQQRILYYEGFIEDISERKRVEEALIAAKQAAEESLRQKSRFLDIAAHELRTPVTAFSLLLQSAQMQSEKGYPVDASILKRLRGQAQRLSRLVIDLLEVSRLERGVLTLKPELTDLVSLISECLTNFKLQSPKHNFVFASKEQAFEICIDKTRIYQVLSNLLDNAIKYSPESAPIEVRLDIQSNSVRVSVIDQGPGISEKQQTTLFTAFERGSTDFETRHAGLGLGLFISRGIMTAHEGRVGVISELGKGSTFYFELPRNSTSSCAA